jgi:hypothetical protein
VELWNAVDWAVPLTMTLEIGTKFAPVTKIARLPLLANIVVGVMEEMRGTGLVVALMVNVNGALMPPPGEGVLTVMEAVPGSWINEAGTVEIRLLVLWKRVGTGTEPAIPGPDQLTVVAGVRLCPTIVSWKAGWPWSMLLGESEERVGDG